MFIKRLLAFYIAYCNVDCKRGVWGVKKLSDKALKALHGKPQDRQKS